ncbi:DNA polymerase III subunit alpha [endosymbiont of Pachyrhynchus infernalis]|uniref:DNA polymerase III subunit alpha n=1 Tax=endosymbiont of Pachyrhynchus infernalis TaxID=1971488 RepID=UPI000DC6F6D7|nr:DNA polymerase III subunit alpha [endosymbiont of Pachyrhynchus infernalis]BBA84796.1 DNA-directed DNA polymerase [endosymbiont of Pachyrhynchus infernalis]
MNEFVHLNIHSEYSIFDSLIKIDDLINLANKFNYSSIAINDFSNLFGVIEFYKSCCFNGIKPIIGSDFYLLEDFNINKFNNFKNLNKITIFCLSNIGYKNLILLISDSYKNKKKSNYPIINKKLLVKYNKELLILYGNINSYLGINILNNDLDKIHNDIKFYKKYFNNRFYIEISRIKKKNEELHIYNALKISKYYKLPIVATNEVRFLSKKDFYFHAIKVSIHNNKSISDNLTKYTCEQFFKSKDDINNIFSDIPEVISNSVEISKRCNVFLKFNKRFLPKFNIDENYCKKILTNLSYKGLKNRLKVEYNNINLYKDKINFYEERLNKELNIINNMGFTGYFLIVNEFTKWAIENNIPIGPGRGSGSGSLVSYSLNITCLDPILFDLIFERFLNPNRISMPDFDIDFCVEKRDMVINHVIELYGKDFVSRIITFNCMTAKSVIKDVGRVLGYTFNFINNISKSIPFNSKITLNELIKKEKKFKDLYENDKEIKKIINISKKLEGYVRNIGKHSGGLVISPYKITKFMPLYYDDSNVLTQFDKKSIEKIGLVKFDFLGLKTLTIINNIINNIKVKYKKIVNINYISLDDKLSFDMLISCKTTGIFQLESKGIKKLIKKLKPNTFKDIIDLIALFRPGPLKSGMVDDFINRRNNLEKVYYPYKNLEHELLINILKPTYGIILYQEQIIKIAQIFSNYSLSEADILRQIISSKNYYEMKKHKLKFINGALNNGINKELSSKIFDLIEKFSGYGFNKSHSASYALITYQMLWLKSNYTIIFMSEVMTFNMNNYEKINNLISECKNMNINIINLNINSSKYDFYVNKNNNIEYGIGTIKGLNKNLITEIINDRIKNGYYKSVLDLCIRIDKNFLNKKSIEILIENGLFNSLKIDKNKEINNLDVYIKKSNKLNNNILNKQIDMFE